MNRDQLVAEAGTAALAVHTALEMWDEGDRLGALKAMYDDGAETDWLWTFVGAQEDITAAEAKRLIDEVTAAQRLIDDALDDG